MASVFELDDYILVNVLLAFLLVNFNRDIATVYVVFSLIDWFMYYIAFDKGYFSIIPMKKPTSSAFEGLVWALGIYVAFIYVSNIIRSNIMAVDAGISPFKAISDLFATTFSTTLVLGSSKIIKLLVTGVLIAIIETRWFFRTLMQWGIYGAKMKLPTSAFSFDAFKIEAFFGALFAVFHIVAKGVTSNDALLVTFFFGAVSVGMVIHFKETMQAVFLHITTNSIAMMALLGIGFFEGAAINFAAGAMTLGWILIVSWFLMFQSIPFAEKLKI